MPCLRCLNHLGEHSVTDILSTNFLPNCRSITCLRLLLQRHRFRMSENPRLILEIATTWWMLTQHTRPQKEKYLAQTIQYKQPLKKTIQYKQMCLLFQCRRHCTEIYWYTMSSGAVFLYIVYTHTHILFEIFEPSFNMLYACWPSYL